MVYSPHALTYPGGLWSFALLEGGDKVRICSPIRYAHITFLYMHNLQLACCRVQNKKQRSFLLQSLLQFVLAEEHLSMNVYSFSLYFALFGLFCYNDHLTVRYALHINKCFWLMLPDSMYTALINHRAVKTTKHSNHLKDDWSKDGEAVHTVHSSAVITLHHKHASHKAPLIYVTISSFPSLYA